VDCHRCPLTHPVVSPRKKKAGVKKGWLQTGEELRGLREGERKREFSAKKNGEEEDESATGFVSSENEKTGRNGKGAQEKKGDQAIGKEENLRKVVVRYTLVYIQKGAAIGGKCERGKRGRRMARRKGGRHHL